MRLRWLLLALLCPLAQAQNINFSPTPTLVVVGAPNQAPNNWACNAASGYAGPGWATEVIQIDLAGNNIWKCTYNIGTSTYAWQAPSGTPTTVDGSGNAIVGEACVHTSATSNTSGVWSKTWPSLGSTVTLKNYQADNTANTLAGEAVATGIATTTGASGIVQTNAVISVLGVNVTVPVLLATPVSVSIQVCATP